MRLKYQPLTDPGNLRHRIQVKTVVRTPDNYGGFARADTVLKTVSAYVQTTAVEEIERDGRLQTRQKLAVTMRKNNDVRQGVTLVYKGQEAYVESVDNPDHEGRFIVAMCRIGGPL